MILIKKGTGFILDQVFTDSQGRYVIITGTLRGTKVGLINVYAPNTDAPDFFTSLRFKIRDLPVVDLIWGEI